MTANVMIVDDDPAIRRTIELMITAGGLDGHEIHLAAGGAECLEAIERGFRGLILMDVMMPGMTGWQTIAAIRDRGMLAGNVICMLTALVDPAGGEHEDVRQHVLHYVTKPFDMDELLDTIDSAMLHITPAGSSENDKVPASAGVSAF